MRRPVDDCGGARRRTLQVRTYSPISCLARHVSRKIFSFAFGMCEKALISLFCWRVEQSDGFAGSCYGFHRFCFCCPFHGLLFHCCTRQFVLQCLTGVHGAFDRRHHRCASGTRSSTRCCSRAVAVIRLQIQEQIVDVPVPQIQEEIVEIVEASGDSTGGRAQIEQIVDVPVPRILEQHVDVIKVIPEEWMSKRIVQQIVDVPVPQIRSRLLRWSR